MGKWTRRAFLTTGVIAGGGLIVGVAMRPGNQAGEMSDLLGDDWRAICARLCAH